MLNLSCSRVSFHFTRPLKLLQTEYLRYDSPARLSFLADPSDDHRQKRVQVLAILNEYRDRDTLTYWTRLSNSYQILFTYPRFVRANGRLPLRDACFDSGFLNSDSVSQRALPIQNC
jgi:hypothetical protein